MLSPEKRARLEAMRDAEVAKSELANKARGSSAHSQMRAGEGAAASVCVRRGL